jgi:hypothetical protein
MTSTSKTVKVLGGQVIVTTEFIPTERTFFNLVDAARVASIDLENSFFTEAKPGVLSKRKKEDVLYTLKQSIKDIQHTVNRLEKE